MKFNTKAKTIRILGVILAIFTFSIITNLVYKIMTKPNINDLDSLVNTSELSEQFMEEYYDGVKELQENDNQENILIVISPNGIKDDFGATKVVEAPNNQYFLQYDSEEEKKQALLKFNEDDSKIDVSENLVREISEDTVIVSNYNSWGVEAMGIDTLLGELQDKELNDVTVAIIDTGLDLNVFNENFPGRLAGAYNVLENNDNMYDNEGHGTHIAGTIAETTPDSVKILPIKVTDSRYMYDTDIITAINYVTYNKNADVINMSFGSYGYSKGEYIAIKAAKENNIISVAAAGNDNSGNAHYPSAMDNTISISAVDSTKAKATFSNFGDSVMFAAPGVDIKSIASTEKNQVMSGTSMATPHAVGAIAILKSLNKSLSFNDTITILRRYSDDLGDMSWDEYFGYGFINFSEADVCDGTGCDEYNVFKSSERDNLDEVVESYEVQPLLSTYNYGTINNILNSKIIIKYTNGKTIEYQLYNIKNLEMSDYDPYSTEKQTITIKFITSLGIEINDSFEITNPINYESVWEYKPVGNNIEITNFKDTSFTGNSLYFPSIIDGYTVTGIADGTTSIFASCWDEFRKVQNLYLPSSLTKIGDYAFSNSNYTNGLNYVKSDAVSLIIGKSAFYGSQSLYQFEGTISYVGDNAFAWGMSLPNLQFSDDITYIGKSAFHNAFNESKLTIPKSVTTIGESAFYNSGLKEIEFLNDMESIPSEMMYNSIKLEKVTLPGGLKEIGESAFYGCSKLAIINLPESLTTIGARAFYQAFSEGKLTIPSNVTTIGESAFYNSGLKEVEFLNDISVISSKMFQYSNKLEKVTLPNNITEIGANAFYYNTSLKAINLPESLIIIGADAFYGAFDSESEAKITIPSNVTTIGESAFERSNVVEVIISQGVEGLSESMFSYNDSLEKVTLPEGLKVLGPLVFDGCSKLTTINLPESLTTIGRYALSDTLDGQSITIPKNVTSMGTNVFDDSGVKEVVFLNDMESIPSMTFRFATKLEKVVLPESLTTIVKADFYDSNPLKKIFFGKNITSIEEGSFEDIETDLTFYVYSNTVPKSFAETNNINYVQIDPDTVSVNNIKNQYFAFEKINLEEIAIELTYNEKTPRKEIITKAIEIEYPDSRQEFRYGDSSIKLIVYNELGYKIEKSLDVSIVKAKPKYTIPTDLTAEIGQSLYDITLPDNFVWVSENITFEKNGNQEFIAKYIPEDTKNYEIVENIKINIAVGHCKTIINPTIEIPNKIYDGNMLINIDTIKISNLDKDEYIIVSAQTLTENVGSTTAKVMIKLSDEKFKDYAFEGEAQEKEFIVNVNIIAQKIDKPTLVEKTYVYNTKEQIIELNNYDGEKMNILGNKRTDAGEQNVTISLKSSNYLWDDETSTDLIFEFKIEKANPEYEIPTGLTAEIGQNLSEIELPENFKWMDGTQIIENIGNQMFKAKYIPTDTDNYKVVENIDVTITVNKKLYTVTFDANGGKFLDDKTFIVVNEWEDSKFASLEKPTKNGYTFKEWNTKADGTGTAYTDKQEISDCTKHLYLYAQWEIIQFRVNYELNGGTQNKNNIISFYVTSETFNLYEPTKKGYTFTGWYLDGTQTKITEVNSGTSKNIDVYASWKANRYGIAYYGNGATSGTTTNQENLKYGMSYNLSSNGFKKKGYTFVGWNTKADGSGKYFNDKLKIKNFTSKNGKVVKLYAIWKKTKYKVNYELNGGVQNKKNATSFYITSKTFNLYEPTKKGYTFTGWYLDGTKTKITKVKSGTSKNIDVYASWKANRYGIAYYGNGATSGTTTNQENLKYGMSYNLSSNGFKKKGYTFVGWNTKADGSGTYFNDKHKIKNFTSKNGKVVKLYAIWKKN